MVTSGYPDYSEVFNFGWSGNYVVHVIVKRNGAARPLDAVFTVHHEI